MFEDDKLYFTRRAEKELELAQRATLPEVVQVYAQLAQAYLERLAPESCVSIELRA